MPHFILSTVRCIEDNKTHVIEGDLRSEELSIYLEQQKTIKKVWLSEDATAIVPKITYDPKSNQLVGLLLPFNETGCPIKFR